MQNRVGLVTSLDGEAAKEKPIFKVKYVACRGLAGKGDGPIEKKLKPPRLIL